MNSTITPPNDNLGLFFTTDRSVMGSALLFTENSTSLPN